MAKKKEHDKRVMDMALHPGKIGLLEGIIMACPEAIIYRPHSDEIMRRPDVVYFDYEHRIIYNVEYKTKGDEVTARTQLQESGAILSQIFPQYRVVNLYVHENFAVEVIR